MDIKTLQLTIRGKVQGVFYRASAKETAEKLGINGWVKNTAEGNVAVLCQGTDKQLQDFLSWCWQGPPKAKVDAIDITEVITVPMNGFNIERGK